MIDRAVATVVIALTAPAFADDVDAPMTAPTTDAAVADGVFAPWVGPAHAAGRRGLGTATAGWDSARRSPLLDIAAEVSVFDRVGVRAAASSSGPDASPSPSVSLDIDVLHADKSGVDLAMGGGWEADGPSGSPGLLARVVVGRSVGASRLTASAQLSAALEDSERHGELALAVTRPVARRLFGGLAARYAIDLERDADEPAGEVDWQVMAGPWASYLIGDYVVTATAGMSALAYRAGGDRRVGGIGMFGFGRAF